MSPTTRDDREGEIHCSYLSQFGREENKLEICPWGTAHKHHQKTRADNSGKKQTNGSKEQHTH